MKILSMSGLMTGVLRRVEELNKTKIKAIEFIKNKINKKNILTISKKISVLSMTLKIATFSLVMATVPAGTMQVNAKNSINKNAAAPYNTNLKLDTSKASVLVLPEANKPKIQIGESEFDKREREAREKEELEASSRTVLARDSSADRISNNDISYDADLGTKRALAKKAAAKFGIDWKLLEAVWQVESGKAWITPVKSYAGAQGPMQFMSGTWNKYAIDGNGDGTADINNSEDAVYAGANLLAQAGAADGDVNSALFSYNHAQWYVDKVQNIANSIED